MKSNTVLSLLTVAILSAYQSTAHEVWIEDTPENHLVARFAEYGDKFEKSPGALDSLSIPSAFIFDDKAKAKGLEAAKKTDHFLLNAAATNVPTHVETTFTVMGGGDKAARKPVFYARWQPAGAGAGQPALTLDLVPTGQPGEARLMLHGKPVAGAKVTAYLPAGADEELTTDETGLVRVKTEAAGLYVLVCKHQREAQTGFWAGRAYDTVSHNCTLAWRIPQKAQ